MLVGKLYPLHNLRIVPIAQTSLKSPPSVSSAIRRVSLKGVLDRHEQVAWFQAQKRGGPGLGISESDATHRTSSCATLWQWAGAATLLAAALLCLHGAPNADARVSTAEAGDTLSGVPRIIDGDTLQVGGEKVRLYGVDAPETKQSCKDSRGHPYACGESASTALKEKLGSSSISCQVKNKDLYQRNVSSCFADGVGDLGHWLVQNGHAVAYQQYSKDYIEDENQAKRDHRGIWQGDFQIPAEWRRERKKGNHSTLPRGPLAALPDTLASQQAAPHPQGCNIKGNVSAKGARIYHVPGGRYYEAVKIEPFKGEQFFCTEADAQKGGFRRSRE